MDNSSEHPSASPVWVMPQSPDCSDTNVKIIAIGNPGCGKSTILNSLAGEILFKSGISLGQGLTFQLDERKATKTGQIFLDTPGLADVTLRKQAGIAISEGLRKGGKYKVIFFFLQHNGRLIVQDTTTLKLVLEAAPEIQGQYGIIVNMIPKKILKMLKEDGSGFLNSLSNSMPEDAKCSESNVLFVANHPDLADEDDVLLSSDSFQTLHGTTLTEFVNKNVPEISLDEEKVGDVNTEIFEETMKIMEDKMNEMLKQYEADLKREQEKREADLETEREARRIQVQEIEERIKLIEVRNRTGKNREDAMGGAT